MSTTLQVQNSNIKDPSFANDITFSKSSDNSPSFSNPVTRLISERSSDTYEIEHSMTPKDTGGYYYFDHIKPPSVAGSLKKSLQRKTEIEIKAEKDYQTQAVIQEKTKEFEKELALALEREKRYLQEIEGLKTTAALKSQLSISDKDNISSHSKFTIETLQRHLEFSQSKIDELTKNLCESDSLLGQTTSKLEESHHTNKALLEKTNHLNHSLQEITKESTKISNELDSLKLWKECQLSKLHDYETCIKHLHSSFSEDVSASFPITGATLLSFIGSLMETKNSTDRKIKELSKEKAELEAKLSTATDSYIRDIEKTKALLQSEKEKNDLSDSLTTRLKESCDFKEKENIELSIRLAKLNEELKLLRLASDEDGIEVRNRFIAQLKALREQFERDRLEFKISLDKMQKEKLGLQTEVGQLLRDRRNFSLEQYRTNHLCLNVGYSKGLDSLEQFSTSSHR